MGMTEIYSTETRHQLIGYCHGIAHAMVRIKVLMGHETAYQPIDPRHTRKLQRRADRLEIPKKAYESLEKTLREIQEVLDADKVKRAAHG